MSAKTVIAVLMRFSNSHASGKDAAKTMKGVSIDKNRYDVPMKLNSARSHMIESARNAWRTNATLRDDSAVCAKNTTSDARKSARRTHEFISKRRIGKLRIRSKSPPISFPGVTLHTLGCCPKINENWKSKCPTAR